MSKGLVSIRLLLVAAIAVGLLGSLSTYADGVYFTELFDAADNDLDNLSITFTPNGSGDYYGGCVTPITALPTDPAGGTPITLSDNGAKRIALDFSQAVELYNLAYTEFYVGSNGYVTFGDADTGSVESLADHFDLPRISALFDDLDPTQGGSVSWMQLGDRAVVTFQNVPQHDAGDSNTFQYEMYYDGRIVLSYLGVDADDGLAGLSQGFGTPGDYSETNLSGLDPCPDYFTEWFDAADNDLDNLMVIFTPDGSSNYYAGCVTPILALPTDPVGGTPITLSDNGSKRITLDFSQTVELYNLGYTEFYVGSNGYITFSAGDSESAESLVNHFDLPRISALFDDLDPGQGGSVSWMQLADRAVVTFQNVPQHDMGDANTFQYEMYYDGRIALAYLGIDADDGLAGLSQGFGTPGDFEESNLSEMPACYAIGDMNCDGTVNNFDIAPFVMALSNPTNYETQYPTCDRYLADVDGDGSVNNFDISPFIALLLGK
ncbi:MAG: hypothetical protein PVJ57_09695 [Phycisphaerae bacterium]|jgi:hypothetical protein